MAEKVNEPDYWRIFNNYLNNHVGLMVFYIIIVKIIDIIVLCLK